jgi:hypothetical protein
MRNGAIERAMHLIPDIAVFQERLACNLQDRRNRAKILGGALFDRAVKTRFICTIGPKTGDQESLARLQRQTELLELRQTRARNPHTHGFRATSSPSAKRVI